MNWIEVTIKTTTEGADIAAQFFYEIGVMGVVIEDPDEIKKAQQEERTWDYIDDSLLDNMGAEVLVKGYLNDDASFYDRLQFLKNRIQWLLLQDFGMDVGTLMIVLNNVKEEDWANHWKQYYKPIKVSDHIVIKPTWEVYQAGPKETILELDPGMAFGTGTHETTVLCIQAIDRHIQEGHQVLDIGCGTGVLAIASLLLGAGHADAVDIDGNAVRVAGENAALNKVNDRMTVIQGNLVDNIHGQYDVVAANIIADVIIHLSKDIKKYIKPGGIFIASGIILDRLDEVLQAIGQAGLVVKKSETLGEWAAVVSQRDA